MGFHKLGVELWIIKSNEYTYGSSNWTTDGYIFNLSAQIHSEDTYGEIRSSKSKK